MHTQKYQMAVNVSVYDESSLDFPSKKVWFDASEWLKSSQYIRVNDFYLIDKKFTPIEDLNTVFVTMALQSEIDDIGAGFPELHVLKDMEPIKFRHFMEGNLSYEYVYTKFDEESLKPIRDLFLIKFIYKEKKYELLAIRKKSNGKYFYTPVSGIYKENGWHKENNDLLTYRNYLAGNIGSYKQ
ncbi:hypothetical protein [Xenorhabdus bovienii]|uniref:hypothetical protein n=1 Tax=Xenorhabdus bovienii TaxID=40576 RepID=UPI0023B286CB|nr:hypothetical protein [Xenorhabdus bovienii]MDE9539598.1 hypothetical protein [Xenorhabdus bovienii]